MSFEGKNVYGQYIDYSEEKKLAQGLHLPLYGTIFYNIRIYSRSQVSVYRTIGPLVVAEVYTFLLVYPLYFSEIFISYLKFSSLFQQESSSIYVSYHILIIHYCSNHLKPISAR